MKIITEIALRNFEFWSGAEERATNLTADELDSVEAWLEEMYPDGMDDGELNDFFWFSFDDIARHLGYEDEEDFDRKHDPNYIYDDELKGEIDEWFQKWLDKHNTIENQASIDLIVGSVALGLFEYDGCLDEEDDYTRRDFENCLEYLRNQHDEDTLYEALFEDDYGECETDGEIPSWEKFRDKMMIEKQSK